MVAARRSLPLRLHKLRLAGDLAEIRTADLRFTQRETREFLERAETYRRIVEHPECSKRWARVHQLGSADPAAYAGFLTP